MNDCLVLRIDNVFFEHLVNCPLMAAIFALILRILSTIQFDRAYSKVPNAGPLDPQLHTSQE